MNSRPLLRRSFLLLVAPLFFTLCAARAAAADSQWLPFRDQNPFVLGSGLPLLPQTIAPGHWALDALIVESNTQLISSENGRYSDDPGKHVKFGAETRETRVSVGYAFDEHWSARASLGQEWIGVGFLDKAIQRFHRLIGAPQGFRGGRLGERPPIIRVYNDDGVQYQLDRPGQALAPLLLDVTRVWNPSPDAHYGISLAAKFATGETDKLSDTGDTGVAATAFGDWIVRDLGPFDHVDIGWRVGYLRSHGNDVLPTLARSGVPVGDAYVRAPLIGHWSVQMQYDVHGALYRNVPIYLGYAGNFTIGLTHPLGERSELLLGIAEDIPVGHTQDASFIVAVRFRPAD